MTTPEATIVCPVVGTLVSSTDVWFRQEDTDRLADTFGEAVFTSKGSEELEARRAFLCADAAVRLFLPLLLGAAAIEDRADLINTLRELPALLCARACRETDRVLRLVAQAERRQRALVVAKQDGEQALPLALLSVLGKAIVCSRSAYVVAATSFEPADAAMEVQHVTAGVLWANDETIYRPLVDTTFGLLREMLALSKEPAT